MNVIWTERSDLHWRISSEIVSTEVVLDMGSGIRPQSFFKPKIHICVDIHRPYLERLRSETGPNSHTLFLNCDWEIAIGAQLDKSVDSVFAIDFIEHLEKKDGSAFLQEAIRVARKQVVLFTPLGFYPQMYEDKSIPDRWDMNGGYWQTHRSGWQPEEFSDEWLVYGCKDYHEEDQFGQQLEQPIGAIWAVLNINHASRYEALRKLVNSHIQLKIRRYLPRFKRLITKRIH